MKTYAEKLKDPRWQKMRLQILERDGFACRRCQSRTETLHVHHAFYAKGRAPWEYEPADLITLCHECHEVAEDEKLYILKAIANPRVSRKLHALAMLEVHPPCDLTFLDWLIDEVAQMASLWKARRSGEISDDSGEVTDQIAEHVAEASRNLYRFALARECHQPPKEEPTA